MKRLLFFLVSVLIFFNGAAQNWNQLEKIVASDREADSRYGYSVSISGDYAVVGAFQERKDASGSNFMASAGAVYVYKKNSSGNWMEIQKLVASDRASYDNFGYSVSISGDYIAVGAHYEQEDASGNNPIPYAGSVYIFKRNTSGTWTEVQKIVPTDRDTSDHFGRTVALDGNYLFVGSYSETDENGNNPMQQTGAVYVFEKNISGNWTQVQKIVSPDRSVHEYFGYSVAVSGSYAVIGAFAEDTDANNGNYMSDAGAAYIYRRDSAGWLFEQKIVPDDRNGGDYFGVSVDIDGHTIVVGAEYEDEDTNGTNSLSKAGSAYIFKRIGIGNWTEVQKIVAPDRNTNDWFGHKIAINGEYILVGALLEDEDSNYTNTLSDAGSAYLFKQNSASGNWNFIKKFTASDRASSDYFSADIDIDGNYAFVGAYLEDEDVSNSNTLLSAGSAYIFFANCTQTSSTIDTTVCFSYTSPSGLYAWHVSGTYTDTIANAGGCDSVITINLTVNSIDTTYSLNGDTIMLNQAGASYIWINCATGDTMENAVNQYFVPANSGTYQAIIALNGCSAQTACITVTVTSKTEMPRTNVIIAPNPVTDYLYCDTNGQKAELFLYTLQGKLLLHKTIPAKIHIENLTPGIYLYKIITPSSVYHGKIIKQ